MGRDTEKLLADMSKLLKSEEWTDVTFIVEGERVKAHRIILASRCEYFRTLLFGDFAEATQKEIPLDVKSEPFKFIIRYLYTGRSYVDGLIAQNISEMGDRGVENRLNILDLAHQYGIGDLVLEVGSDFERILSTETIHWILNTAVFYDMKYLLDESLKFADRNVLSVVSHVAFTSLSDAAVKELLKRDTFAAAEIDIFNSVKAWCDKRPTRENADIMGLVRWSLMSSDDLSNVVQPGGMVSRDVVLDAIEQQNTGKLPFRGVMSYSKIPYKIIRGERYIDLGPIFFINFIQWDHKFLIKFVEVSIDLKCWKRLILTECQLNEDWQVKDEFGWKHWTFPMTATRFIRLKDSGNQLPRFTKAGLWVMYRPERHLVIKA